MAADAKTKTTVKRVLPAITGSLRKDARFADFLATLFAGGSNEDLANTPSAQLAGLARAAYDKFTRRTVGRYSLTIGDLEGSEDASLIVIVNDDMPFLVDSVVGVLNESNHTARLVLHPLYYTRRETGGRLRDIVDEEHSGRGDSTRESLMAIVVERLATAEERAALKHQLVTVLAEVRTIVLDWETMMTRLRGAIRQYKDVPPPIPVDELAEAIQFLEWLIDGNFIFLGLREFEFDGNPETAQLVAKKDSGRGILRDPDVHVLRRAGKLVSITPEIRQFLLEPAPLIITKANVKARVHRRAYMDYIGVKNFDAQGRLSGEIRLVGLFTSSAYHQSVRRIPLLRRKVDAVMDMSHLKPDSHAGKALMSVLENYPRDDLFQIDVQSLYEIADGMRGLGERPRTRLFVRRDKFDRFVSAIVFFPRDRFNTSVRMRTGELLAEAYRGRISAYYPAYPEGDLVRVHFIVGRDEDETPTPDLPRLEARIADLARTWDDHFTDAVNAQFAAREASAINARYKGAFSAAYCEDFSPADAIDDVRHIERLDAPGDIGVVFYRGGEDGPRALRLKIFHLGAPIALSDRLPILEAMALRAINERYYRAGLRGDNARDGARGDVVRIHDIVLEAGQDIDRNFGDLKPLLEDCFLAVWNGTAANDGYNALVLLGQISWRDVVILRAYSKYLRQAGIGFSQRYMWTAMSKHIDIAGHLIELFRLRFDPARKNGARARKETRIIQKIEEALAVVSVLDEDRIIRRFLNVILSTLRTNVFQNDPDSGTCGALAFKLDSTKVDALPQPRPLREIFIYSPDVEGVHLRSGMIARGGLRWSDRPEDFRTEILGLVKAQQVKNAVIVPVGSKGGFVPQKLPLDASREDIQAEAVRCYRIFISGLLCLTDNLKGAKVVKPRDTVCYDGDDPYLVVAADKGTATFSDIANGISQSRKFWLDDAFASGGSAGYDHKKMGITARGGWEAVKRHFREMDIDIQRQPFSVVGVGDMSGDVFGNGMLLSRKTRLVAAFDHRDIFIDPDPDPASSHAERKRLFALARSSWRDYNTKLISAGGGVFSRSEKSIALSPEIRKMTGLGAASATPVELIRALLRMEADLLWFGGIGTYIRASDETDDDAGDRANDALRITAPELKVKVIGEGANLGLTQRARIEFAMRGGRVNSDAIDNSAGVNSSDIEVNIKIAFGAVEAAGKLTREERNAFLAAMTKEVASLVLRNNYRQTLAVSLAEARGYDEMGFQVRLMRTLERRGLLDRAVEFLPDDAELAEREAQRQPLTRPELAVLLAYAKITLYDELLASDMPDDAYLAGELERYFPVRLWKAYPDAIARHRLRREIIATMLANSIINRGGPSFVSRLSDETGADAASIAAAFAIARDSFDLLALNDAVDALDNKIASGTQISLYLTLQNVLGRQTSWFLTHASGASSLKEVIDRFRDGIATLRKALGRVLAKEQGEALKEQARKLTAQKVPARLAGDIAELAVLSYAPDIILVAGRTGRSIADVARAFFDIGALLDIDQLERAAGALEAAEYFDRLAVNRIVDGLQDSRRRITADVLQTKGGVDRAVARWRERQGERVEKVKGKLDELFAGGALNLSKLTLANSYLRDLLQN